MARASIIAVVVEVRLAAMEQCPHCIAPGQATNSAAFVSPLTCARKFKSCRILQDSSDTACTFASPK